MNKRLIAALLLLSGCATVPSNAPRYARAAEPPAGWSNVYIYRIGAHPTLRAPVIRMDGRAVFSPAERAYTVIPLEAGEHELMIDWPWDNASPDLKFPITVEAGEPLYIKIGGSILPSAFNVSHTAAFAQRIPQPQAEGEMTICCRYVPPRDGR
jgi:hypothetical protein